MELVEVWEPGNGLRYELMLQHIQNETPNDIYGDWKMENRHIGGITVALSASDQFVQSAETTHWRHCDTTPAQLAREYAARGMDRPDSTAYQHLRAQLRDAILGDSLHVVFRVSWGNITLAEDSIGTCTEYLGNHEEAAREVMADYFDVFELTAEALRHARTYADELDQIAA